MWSTLKISSGAQLGHDKRDIPAFDTVLFHSNLSSLRRKYLSDVTTDKVVLSSGAKISKRPLKRGHWWLKNKEGKCHFRFVERRFLAAINCTGSAEGALVPVLLRITHWTKSGLPQGGKRPGGETGSPLLGQCVMRRRTGTSAPSALPVQLMAAKNLLSTNRK